MNDTPTNPDSPSTDDVAALRDRGGDRPPLRAGGLPSLAHQSRRGRAMSKNIIRSGGGILMASPVLSKGPICHLGFEAIEMPCK
jgi:hypothetical protein